MAAIIQEMHSIVQHKNKILNNWLNKERNKLFRCHKDDIVGQPYRQRLRDQLIPAFSRKAWKGEGFEKWRPSWISFHHPTSHGPSSRVAPNLARDLKKGTVWDRYNMHFSSVIAWLVIYHVLWLTPFSINRLGLNRSGQNVGIEYDVMAHVMLVATGRWSRGWWDHCAGWLRLDFSSLLLDVILNQNPIIINSTN